MATGSLASEASGKVFSFDTLEGSIVVFDVGPHANRPACSNPNRGDPWPISLNSHTGPAMQAALLYAQAAGRTVEIHKAGQCTAGADREAAFYSRVLSQ